MQVLSLFKDTTQVAKKISNETGREEAFIQEQTDINGTDMCTH